MKNILIGFTIGVVFMLCCAFSTGNWRSSDISTSANWNQSEFNVLVHNQQVIAKMIESASCKQ